MLSITFLANGWVLLMGHGLSQVASLCKAEAKAKDMPLNISGWTSPSADIPRLNSPKEGRDNESFVVDGENKRGKMWFMGICMPISTSYYNRNACVETPQTFFFQPYTSTCLKLSRV